MSLGERFVDGLLADGSAVKVLVRAYRGGVVSVAFVHQGEAYWFDGRWVGGELVAAEPGCERFATVGRLFGELHQAALGAWAEAVRLIRAERRPGA